LTAHFGRDAEALIEKLREAPGAEPLRPRRRPALIAIAAAVFLAGVIGLIQLGIPVWVPWSPKPGPTQQGGTAEKPTPAPAIAASDCPDDYRALDADSPPLTIRVCRRYAERRCTPA
jgi:hypothetical protein